VKRRYGIHLYGTVMVAIKHLCLVSLPGYGPGNPHILGALVRKPNISALASSRGI